tara:strand:- start:292 stop:1086 length:795 start_codon:yes stop_codon:yes gene_type:complete
VSFYFKINYSILKKFRKELIKNIPTVKIKKNKSSSLDFVTNADFKMQKLIKEFIRTYDKKSKIISEEESNLRYINFEENFWLIDPLDGTLNFASKIPCYCISVAYITNGVVIFSFVININTLEIFYAYKNNGAYFNGAKIINNQASNLINISSSSILELNKKNKLNNFPKGFAMRNIGSQSLALCYLANGSFSAVINKVAKVWDDVAAILIITESKGSYYSNQKLKGKISFNKDLNSLAVHSSKIELKKILLDLDDKKRYLHLN